MSRISRGSLSKWQGLLLRSLVTRARFVVWVGVSSSRSRLSMNIIRRRLLLFAFILAGELMRSVKGCECVDLSGREGCRLGFTEKRDYKGEGRRLLARHSPPNDKGRSPSVTLYTDNYTRTLGQLESIISRHKPRIKIYLVLR
jgi:hypothetical protein